VCRGRPALLAGRLLGQPRCRRRPAQAQRKAPARDLRRSCSFAAAVHHRRLRPGSRWLGALAGWACRSVSAGKCPCGASGSLRANANERAAKNGQPGKERAGVTEAATEGCGPRQDGQDEEAEEEDRRREVAAAGSTRGRVKCEARRVHELGRADLSSRRVRSNWFTLSQSFRVFGSPAVTLRVNEMAGQRGGGVALLSRNHPRSARHHRIVLGASDKCCCERAVARLAGQHDLPANPERSSLRTLRATGRRDVPLLATARAWSSTDHWTEAPPGV
jgi:hypothetical protein